MKKLLSLLLLVAMVYSLGTVVFASSNVGYGQGVSDVPPDIPVVIFGASPPSSSNGYVDLGTYDGEIAYLCKGSLYSNKWVRSSTTTIKIDSEFRSYGSQVGCENRTNPLTIPQTMEVNLIASDGTKIAKIVSASSNALRHLPLKPIRNIMYIFEPALAIGLVEISPSTSELLRLKVVGSDLWF